MSIALTPLVCDIVHWPTALACMSVVSAVPLLLFLPLRTQLSRHGARAQSGNATYERTASHSSTAHSASTSDSNGMRGMQGDHSRMAPPVTQAGSVAVGAPVEPRNRYSSDQEGIEMKIKSKGGQRDVGAEADDGGRSTSGHGGVDAEAWSRATGQIKHTRDAGRASTSCDEHAGGQRWALFALAWAHAAIGWGFFTFSNWIPTYVNTLKVGGAGALGAASAAPWAATAVAAFTFGPVFQRLRRMGMSAFTSQSTAHTAACLGAAAALLPLATAAAPSPQVSLACIGAALALQTCNYSGFHAYVQTFGANRAGSILGVTNSGGILAGMAANSVLASTVRSTGSYATMFGLTALVYASSWVLWMLCLRGDPLRV